MAVLLLFAGPNISSADALPSLSLLNHQVRVVPAEISSAVRAPQAEVWLVDARTDLVAARSLCRLLAQAAPVPIMAIASTDTLAALTEDWGLSDFVQHTIGPAELQARLRLLRRSDRAAEPVSASGVVIDEAAYTARLHGTSLDLTYTEFELLKFLAQNPGRAFSRQQLLSDVWGYDYYGGTRTVDVHVRRLRAKLGPEHESIIQTVRNVGYRLMVTEATAKGDDPLGPP